MIKNWKYITIIVDGETFVLEGLNIWDYEWTRTGETANVKDPLYGRNHKMTVYEISGNGSVVKFAAGEFLNCIWGIYQQHD